jgi:hypothetical protein
VEFEAEDGSPVEYSNLGLQPDGSLRLECRVTDTSTVGETMPALEGMDVPREHLDAAVTSHVTFWVETTPTMQPRRAYYDVMSVAPNGDKSLVESHLYTFSW